MSCPICGAKVKDPTNPRHVKSKRHQAALKRQAGGPKVVSPPKSAASPAFALENRVSALEQGLQKVIQKVDFLIDEISMIQQKLAGQRFATSNSSPDPAKFPQAFLSALDSRVRQSGASSPWIPIETIYATLPAPFRNWQQLEELISVLFDRGIIALGEGGGSKKVILRGKQYGLVRKK
jgi:2-phospho-L-lactate guanylyltransferase (CobY/MobA/RfbA family)